MKDSLPKKISYADAETNQMRKWAANDAAAQLQKVLVGGETIKFTDEVFGRISDVVDSTLKKYWSDEVKRLRYLIPSSSLQLNYLEIMTLAAALGKLRAIDENDQKKFKKAGMPDLADARLIAIDGLIEKLRVLKAAADEDEKEEN